jgi:class 3 adenylate cyclase
MSSPTTVQTLIRQATETDVRQILPLIEAPTLVMHRPEFQGLPLALSQYLADRIPDAQLVELPGSDGPPWFDHPEVIIDAIAGFVAGIVGDANTETPTERVMATVLFTDLVASTELAEKVGDVEWRHLLQFHDDTASRCVRETGGRLVKTTGDGILATFESPGRAIRCASMLGRGLSRRGMSMRAGIHTGEIEIRNDDVGGIAVHVASRVMSAAGPGEILVSRTVRELVVGSEFTLNDRGEHTLKGIEGEWRLFAVADG